MNKTYFAKLMFIFIALNEHFHFSVLSDTFRYLQMLHTCRLLLNVVNSKAFLQSIMSVIVNVNKTGTLQCLFRRPEVKYSTGGKSTW